MPYIPENERDEIREAVDGLVHAIFSTDEAYDTMSTIIPVGRLNYAITRLCHMVLAEGDIRYTRISGVRSALQDANDEYYEQVFVPYEKKMKKKNGSVSSLDA